MPATSAAVRPRRFTRNDFYRYCRLVHGWLSAFAFLALCFFSITGLLLNHPDWSMGDAPAPVNTTFKLTADELAELQNADRPGETLARMASTHITVRGGYSDGDQVGNEIFVRLQGVRGLTDLRASLYTGEVKAIIEPARAFSVLNELHRGERAGVQWRLLIDLIAILLILLSVIGYLIFLSLRYRLRTALLLTAGSSLGLWGFFVLVVR